MEEVTKSFFARWNAASLDTSIAAIYPAGEFGSSKQNDSGTTEGVLLPRAEYTVANTAPDTKTRNSRIFKLPITVKCYSTSMSDVSGYLTSIRAKFVNSEGLMSMTGGTILEVDEGAGFTHKTDDGNFMCQIILVFRVRIGNALAV